MRTFASPAGQVESADQRERWVPAGGAGGGTRTAPVPAGGVTGGPEDMMDLLILPSCRMEWSGEISGKKARGQRLSRRKLFRLRLSQVSHFQRYT